MTAHQSTARKATMKDDMMNGKGTKLLLIIISGLFLAATAGSYVMTDRLSAVESKMDAMLENQRELKARVLYLERTNPRGVR